MGRSAAAAAAAGAFTIVPNKVLPAPDRTSPNDQIVFGHIGIGGRGLGFVRPGGSSAALCDIDENRLQRAKERAGGNPRLYNDYRKLLEQKDIDAVFIASPDHWHALHAIHACQAGKDVYCEKPACKSVEEGQEMIAAARRYARVVQIGSQGRSQEGAYHACKYIQNGQIGRVDRVECWHYPSPSAGWPPNETPPPELDYEKWVGPSRWIDYNPRRTHGSFRWMMFSGGGQIRDRGAHVMSCALWIMDADDQAPVTIDAASGRPPYEGIYDSAVHMEVVYEFKNPDWTLIWAQPGKPQEYEEFTFPRTSYGAKYFGDKGDLVLTYGDTPDTDTEKKAKDYEVPEDGVQVFHSPGHRENFEDCIRSREKPIMDVEAGVKVAYLCILGNLSFVLGRKLEWDAQNLRVKNDEEANRLLRIPQRGEWQI